MSRRKRRKMNPKEEENEMTTEQFQRAVLNMITLHPKNRLIANLVFERMPMEGFKDAKNVLASSDETKNDFDGLLSLNDCQLFLNRFEREEPLLKLVRAEYERNTDTRPPLSGIPQIMKRLNHLKKKIHKIYGSRHWDWESNGALHKGIVYTRDEDSFDLDYMGSIDYFVSNKQLCDLNEDYYETDFLYDSGRLNTFYGEELDEYNEASDVVLFVYYLDREEDDIVKPILIKTIEVGPYEELQEHILSGDIDMNPDSPFTQHRLFDLVGSKLMVFNRHKSSEEFHHYDYYDLEKTRLDLPDLVHSVDTVPFAVYDRVEGWWKKLYYCLPETENLLGNRSLSSDFCFPVIRKDDEGYWVAELHELSSLKIGLVRRLRLDVPKHNEIKTYKSFTLGRSTWAVEFEHHPVLLEENDTCRTINVVYIDKRTSKMIEYVNIDEFHNRLFQRSYISYNGRLYFQEADISRELETLRFGFFEKKNDPANIEVLAEFDMKLYQSKISRKMKPSTKAYSVVGHSASIIFDISRVLIITSYERHSGSSVYQEMSFEKYLEMVLSLKKCEDRIPDPSIALWKMLKSKPAYGFQGGPAVMAQPKMDGFGVIRVVDDAGLDYEDVGSRYSVFFVV